MKTIDHLNHVKKYYAPIAEVLSNLEGGNCLPDDYIHLSVRQAKKNKMLFYGTTEATEPLLGIISRAQSPMNRMNFEPKLRTALDTLYFKLIAYDEKLTEVRYEFERTQEAREELERASSSLDRQAKNAVRLLRSKIKAGEIKLADILQSLMNEDDRRQGKLSFTFEEFLINGIPDNQIGNDPSSESLRIARTELEKLIVEVANEVEPLRKHLLDYIDRCSDGGAQDIG